MRRENGTSAAKAAELSATDGGAEAPPYKALRKDLRVEKKSGRFPPGGACRLL